MESLASHMDCFVKKYLQLCPELAIIYGTRSSMDGVSMRMNQQEHVVQLLNELITTYRFNINTLSKYLELPPSQLECLSQGDSGFYPKDPVSQCNLFHKVLLLHASAAENKDRKLCAFLKVLISYHGLSLETIAKMAGVETKELEPLLSDSPDRVSEGTKYKVAVTVMALRFFLKDCEPTL